MVGILILQGIGNSVVKFIMQSHWSYILCFILQVLLRILFLFRSSPRITMSTFSFMVHIIMLVILCLARFFFTDMSVVVYTSWTSVSLEIVQLTVIFYTFN